MAPPRTAALPAAAQPQTAPSCAPQAGSASPGAAQTCAAQTCAASQHSCSTIVSSLNPGSAPPGLRLGGGHPGIRREHHHDNLFAAEFAPEKGVEFHGDFQGLPARRRAFSFCGPAHRDTGCRQELAPFTGAPLLSGKSKLKDYTPPLLLVPGYGKNIPSALPEPQKCRFRDGGAPVGEVRRRSQAGRGVLT